MEQGLNESKVPRFVSCEESGEASTEKLVPTQQNFNLAESKLEKSSNQNAVFQINSLILAQPPISTTRASPNSDGILDQQDQEPFPAGSNKVEARYKKRKKVMQFDLIFKSYYEFLENSQKSVGKSTLVQYYERRWSVSYNFECGKIDLGVCTMREVVQFCYKKNIISSQVYVEYSLELCFTQEENFVNKLNQKKFESLELDKMYFTPFEHRLFCMILSKQFPDHFLFPCKLTLENLKLTKFYNYLYDLPDEQYLNLMQNLNEKLNRSWMPDDLQNFSQQVSAKLKTQPNKNQDQSYPFHMPPRKLRKKY